MRTTNVVFHHDEQVAEVHDEDDVGRFSIALDRRAVVAEDFHSIEDVKVTRVIVRFDGYDEDGEPRRQKFEFYSPKTLRALAAALVQVADLADGHWLADGGEPS